MAIPDDLSYENAIRGNTEKTVFHPSSENETTPDGSIRAGTADWTHDEERRLVRKYITPIELKRLDS
jgi:hypothetical protein